MSQFSSARSTLRSALPAALLLTAGPGVGRAADTYVNGVLTIPSVIIGNADYTNLVVDVQSIAVPPTAISVALLPGDIWNPVTAELYAATANVGPTSYYNGVGRIGNLVSIGSVAGADTYAGGSLQLPAVQVLGGSVYTGVQVAVAPQDIQGVAGGMPQVRQNVYDPTTHQLTVPVAAFNGRYYTNVTATVLPGQVQQVQGGPQLQDTVLYSFTGGSDGAEPFVSVIQGTDGNFYGTTFYGGSGGQPVPGSPTGFGTVFMLTPAGEETILHSFQGAVDGANPYGALVEYQGNFYGTTNNGGPDNAGTVFEVTPQGQFTLLWSFKGGVAGSFDGISPNGLVLANDGNFYGTTFQGGTAGYGIVYRIAPDGSMETPLYSFKGGNTDGAYSNSSLVQGTDGFLYGTTVNGGPTQSGTLFKVSLTGTETLLHAFGAAAGSDGAMPYANVIQANDGNFYGTTFQGGAHHAGTVFEYNPGTHTESVLYSFGGGGGVPGSVDGGFLYGGVIQATDGDLYGATNNGGAYNAGTIFRLTLAGQETTLYSFSGISFSDGHLSPFADGANPNGVIQAADGSLYGTAYLGGPVCFGDVFRLSGAVP